MTDIRIDRVVTRGGDGGQTSLGDGTRVSKADLRIEALGTVDEVNALLGVLRYYISQETQYHEQVSVIARIQACLFDLGADLCIPGAVDHAASLPDAAVIWLEAQIEGLRASQSELRSFILPGGSLVAAQAHMLRTVVRRAERKVVALHDAPPHSVRFLNRLSDYFFVLARYANSDGRDDILWERGQWQREPEPVS